jgi:hypothetical protein
MAGSKGRSKQRRKAATRREGGREGGKEGGRELGGQAGGGGGPGGDLWRAMRATTGDLALPGAEQTVRRLSDRRRLSEPGGGLSKTLPGARALRLAIWPSTLPR